MATDLPLPSGEARDELTNRLDRAHRQAGERVAAATFHRRLIERVEDRTSQLAAEEHVLDDVEVVAQREVLVHDLDAVAAASRGPWIEIGGPFEQELSRVDRVDAADALDERRLAGAVVADQRHDFAGIHVEVDVVQDLDCAKALVDTPQREDGRISHHVPL